MSEPSSPSSPLLTQAPKWLRQTSRGVGNARYLLRVLTLAIVCIVLGVSVSTLYEANNGASMAAPDTTTELGEDAPYLQELREMPWFHEIDLTENNTFSQSITSEKSSASMLQRLRHKIHSLNPWAFSEDRLTCSTSSNQTLSDSSNTTIQELMTVPLDPISSPLVAKVTIMFGKPNPAYERAIRTHDAHNRLHDYPMFTLRESIMNDVWSKPSYILSAILRELAKPPHERLQWLFWVDADTIIINPYVPLETFLPPQTKEWEDVHLLVTNDWNGLNNGVFPIRVCEWSVQLLSAVIAYPHYRPDDNLQFRDQSAMERLLSWSRFAKHTVRVPQRWFNTYQGEIDETVAPFQTHPGDLLVHFAGVGDRETRMEWWLDRAEQHLPEWEVEFKYTTVKAEVERFWTQEGSRREARFKDWSAWQDEWSRRRAIIVDFVQNHEAKGLTNETALGEVKRALDEVDQYLKDDNIDVESNEVERKLAPPEFEPVMKLVETAYKPKIREAREKLALANEVMLNLDLEMYGAQDAEESMSKVEESVRKYQALLKSRLFTGEHLDKADQELTNAQVGLEGVVSKALRNKWKFDDEKERVQGEEDEEMQVLKEQLKLEVEEEWLREQEEAAQFVKEPVQAEDEQVRHIGQDKDDSDEIQRAKIRANRQRRLRQKARQKKAAEDVDQTVSQTGEIADSSPEPEPEFEPATSAFMPNKAAVKLDTSKSSSADDASEPESTDSAEPTQAEAVEVPDREKWWKEEGRYSEGALTELMEEAEAERVVKEFKEVDGEVDVGDKVVVRKRDDAGQLWKLGMARARVKAMEGLRDGDE